MSKGKIAIIVLVIALAGFGLWKWKKSREPKIIIGNKHIDKTDFVLSYKGMKYEDSIAFGQIKKKTINGHTFEAVSQASTNQGNSTASKKIVFAIKDQTNKVLITETITV